MQKSWHLNRRTFLRGTGVALSLPWLESMSKGSDAAESPVRMASVYFPFGVSLPGDKSEHADWNWVPKADGDSFAFTSLFLIQCNLAGLG